MTRLSGQPRLSQIAYRLVFLPPLVRPPRHPRPLFDARAGRFPVGPQIRRVDHQGLLFAVLGGQTCHRSCEDTPVVSPFPTVVEGLVRPVSGERIPPPQAIAIDTDNPARNAPVIDTLYAVALRNDELGTRNLRIRQQ